MEPDTPPSPPPLSRPFPPRLLFLVTEDWYFCSHRLPIARALRDAGFHVAVACRVGSEGQRILDEGFTLFPLSLSRRSINPLAALAAVISLVRLYRRFRPDAVHHVALKPALLGSLAARLAGVPLVVNAIAGLGFVFSAERLRARLLRPLVWFGLSRLLDGPNCRVIVQNADDGAALRARKLVAPEHLHLIRGSGVDPGRFRPAPEPSGPVRFTLVARMIREKGVHDLVAATALLKRRGRILRTSLAGGPDPENPSSLSEDTLNAWATDGDIEVLGPVSDIPALWRESHVGVLPSYYGEGVPLSLIEAAAAGRALIAADRPGLNDIVRHEETGLLVPPRDPEALAAAMARLLDDAPLRLRLGAAARRHAEAHFSVNAVTTATLALYREALGPRWPEPPGQPETPPSIEETP